MDQRSCTQTSAALLLYKVGVGEGGVREYVLREKDEDRNVGSTSAPYTGPVVIPS
jgi:hypothetical protein